MKNIPVAVTLFLVLGGASAASAQVSAFNGTACASTPGVSSFDEARPTWVVGLGQPRGLTTTRGDRDVNVTCPVPIDPTLAVHLIEFWAYDRHTNFDVRCTASLQDHEGNDIATLVAGTTAFDTGPKYFQVDFGGLRGHNLRLTCSIPRFHSSNGHSILASYHVEQR
jgi:hypothetical protein